MRYYHCLLTFLIIAGCGKAPDAETKSQPAPRESKPAATPPADTRPAVVAFGDSLSAGFGADVGKSYPDYLQKAIDRAGLQYHVINEGISGDTTSGGVERMARVIAMKPAVVILELGGNDGLRGLPASLTRSNMDQMAAGFTGAGIQVLLAGMTLPPNYGDAYIHEFESIYKDTAKKYKAPLIPFLLYGVATNPALMQRDGIHPTAEGNEKVAALVMKYLKPLLK